MQISKARLNGLIHKGNTPLTVGVAWSIFGITLCPCPVYLLGSLSMLTLGLAEKFGFIRYIKLKARDHHDDCEKCNGAK